MRKLDDAIGRFTSIDQLWEQFPEWSPYQYGYNNPLVVSDPSAKQVRPAHQVCPDCGGGNPDRTRRDQKPDQLRQHHRTEDDDEEEQDESSNTSVGDVAVATGVVLTTALVADDASVVGVADDVLIPVIWAVVGIVWTPDQLLSESDEEMPELPVLDGIGQLHGELPEPEDLDKFDQDELEQLLDDLKESVENRIRTNSNRGKHRSHGQRLGAEQDLIKQLQQHLHHL